MLVRIDVREKELITKCLACIEREPKYSQVRIVSEPLPLADVIITNSNGQDLLYIERKEVKDLIASLKDKRYEEQSFRLNNINLHNHNIIYLVEGVITSSSNNKSPSKYKSKQTCNNDICILTGKLPAINQNQSTSTSTSANSTTISVYSAMFSLMYYKGFSVMRSFNMDETATILCNMAYKIGVESSKKNGKTAYYMQQQKLELEEPKDTEALDYAKVCLKKVKKNNITKDNIQDIMLAQIPMLSTETASAILSYYKSIYGLVDALRSNPNSLEESGIKVKGKKLRQDVIANIKEFLV